MLTDVLLLGVLEPNGLRCSIKLDTFVRHDGHEHLLVVLADDGTLVILDHTTGDDE
jgi:hypothetical protein